ncbi:hypothetical protein G7A72_13335 [Flavobacterium sp. Sr18]|uniref:hypothetical protein n=1 Tax=Flavobacterium sp. Sr18 TaxID=935222 RepID=UPI0013E4C1EB|nr:hypothetical protein [Flavobacterium sp. Sr18]QIH39733.1 hypothetical protein G7A72_13335 [Flavobacterium sp. Sr18]
MDFYNFEKYNDLFSFEKLNGDYQPLLKTYKGSYHTSMNTFLKEYEENTELRFIESQLYFCNKEIIIQKSIIISLERLDHETFYYVRNRVSETHFVYLEKLYFQGDETDEVDETELCIHATAKNFIKFISNRITSLCLINEFLVQRKQELEKESNIKVPAPKDIDSRNLTANQLALIMVYNGNTMVTRNEHGDDLYNKVTKWVKSKTRTADPDTTKLVLENKIKLFESIIPFLLEENRQKAIDEIKTLKLHLLKY